MKRIIVSVILIFTLLLLGGCKKEVTVPFAPNEAIPYIRYEYDICPLDNVVHNLTDTDREITDWDLALGYHIVTSAEELQQYSASCEENLRTKYAQYYNWPQQEENIYLSAFPFSLAEETSDITLDAAFFADSNLLIVDLCGVAAIHLYSRPEQLQITKNQVAVEVAYGGLFSSTADNAGNLLLIPVPKACNYAAIELTEVKEWTNHANPLD